MAHVMHLQIRDGKGKAVLKKDQITQTFKNINELVGSSLYVSVSVLTETGKHLSIHLSLSICLSIYISICVAVFLSVCLC